MFTRTMSVAVMIVAAAGAAEAQAKKPAGAKSVMHDITITTTESVYTGTMAMAVDRGKVTGDLHLTKPTDVTGKVAGTSNKGVLTLDFPYHMTERKCDGTVKMNIKLPAKPGPASGTMEAVGCGRDESRKLLGTVQLTPAAPLAKPKDVKK